MNTIAMLTKLFQKNKNISEVAEILEKVHLTQLVERLSQQRVTGSIPDLVTKQY